MKKILMILIVGMFLVSFASALTVSDEQTSFDLGSWLRHTFSIQSYSIVGDSQGKCGINGLPNVEYELQAGSSKSFSVPSICSNSGHGIVDIFNNGWNPFREYDEVLQTLNCVNGPCHIQIYCCPYKEPTQNSDCIFVGQSSTVQTASCVSWINSGYKCTSSLGTESSIPYYKSSFNYCSPTTTKTCYYYDYSGTECKSHTYPDTLFCSTVGSGTYQGYKLYDDKSVCDSKISAPVSATCSDGIQNQGETGVDCGGPCSACGTTPPPVTPTGNCGNGVCDSGESSGVWNSGSINPVCVQDCERTLSDKVTILDLTYTNGDGSAVSGPLVPGQTIQIHGRIKADVPWTFQPYLVEMGIIPAETAKSWGMYSPSGFFSLFAISESNNDACCLGQTNIADNMKEWVSWTTTEAIKEFSYTIQVPKSDTKDICGSEKYWDGNNSEYLIYAVVKNGCYKDGFRRNVFSTVSVELKLNETTTQGKTCITDGDCDSGQKCTDISGDYSSQKYCVGGIVFGGSLIELKKLSLTSDEISSGTNTELLASACLTSDECLPRSNYSVSCISIDKLKEQGIVGAAQGDSILEDGKQIVTNGVIGGALGGAAGLITCIAMVGGASAATAATAGAGAPLLAPAIAGCGAVATAGAAIGAGLSVGGTLLWQQNPSDNLVTALKAKDANSVGICTAQASGSFDKIISSLAFFKITGVAQTDGLIIGGTILLVLAILLFRK